MVLLTPGGADSSAVAHQGGLRLDKRYQDEESGFEALCAKPGAGLSTIIEK